MKLCHSILLWFPVFLTSATSQVFRKSLSFGPRHPTRYVNRLQPAPGVTTIRDPYDVAKSFLSNHVSSDYYIRPDSYTDRNSGVTHVYVRQRVAQLDVANGDINLNIRDGQVLSYGDSFYRGEAPSSFTVRPLITHATYCAELARIHTSLIQNGDRAQIPLAQKSDRHGEFYNRNCLLPLAAVQAATSTSSSLNLRNPHDPRWAALYFMVAAHPHQDFLDDLVGRFETHLERMVVEQDQDSADRSSLISNVPGALSPIEARLVYIQCPDENNTMGLHPAWRMVVEMEDNWYEAYVSASEPTDILSVVDWASDAFTPRADIGLNAPEALPHPDHFTARSRPASYNVWKWGINDPESGVRSIEIERYDQIASPYGWHAISKINNPAGGPDPVETYDERRSKDRYLKFSSTWGNNAFAQENWEGEKNWVDKNRPEADSNMKFDCRYCLDSDERDLECSPKDYVNVSTTQLFYTTNLVHDLFYRYGFDEISGNFQQDNYGRGGQDGDAIIAQAQDGGGFDNANFMTVSSYCDLGTMAANETIRQPPDGKHGRCRMYLWDFSTPYRDGALDAGILIHELTHGLSNRLTGGPANSGCLAYGEDGGMNEGWSDFMATVVRSAKTGIHEDYAIGSWAYDDAQGLRDYLYSTNVTVNPLTYASMNEPGYWGSHEIGTVWAETLWVVLHRLVEKHGYSATLFPPQPLANGTVPSADFYLPRDGDKPLVPKHGNTLMVQLVIQGMKLQPCRPSFFDARDAIIEADRVLTGGQNLCELWAGFSSRGLGIDASIRNRNPWGGGHRTNGFKVPIDCR
ncbi:Fungalysin/Thermolysin Extracellular metalloproteinase 5 [Ceratobasidium sp. 395]|nr:Fungalysin/Thermolysin Extracellular metalloproteinase 5 [Ceratobasidium sp. 395]